MPVPSSGGRVTLTMPILVPLSDLLGLSRQVTVTATQFGPGVLNQFLPTDGTLMAVLAIAAVRFEQWLKFCLPICAVLFTTAWPPGRWPPRSICNSAAACRADARRAKAGL